MEEINTAHTGRSCLHSHHCCRLCMITKNLFDQSLYLRFFAWMTKGLFLRTCCFLCSLLLPARSASFLTRSCSLSISRSFSKARSFSTSGSSRQFEFSLYYDPVHIFRVRNIDKIKAIGGKKRSGTVIHLHMDTLRHKLRTASAIRRSILTFRK